MKGPFAAVLFTLIGETNKYVAASFESHSISFSIPWHMGSNTDSQPPLSLQERLSRLQELLREKQEVCSEVHKLADERNDEKTKRKVEKEAKQEEMRRKVFQMVSEQEEERDRHSENNAEGSNISVDPHVLIIILTR
jgi:hypothetical protein